ncbi:MAG: hypothetical protein RLN90_03905 [Balneolaceae bacterium]
MRIKKILEFVFIGLLFWSCTNKRTELVLLGTVHQPIQNFTPDSLYNILVKIEPDLILFEVDSSFFTKDFEFKKTWESNENIATVKYMNNFDVDLRPYEFTGRNEYRIRIGSRPTDSKALELLDSLYNNNLLNSLSKRIYQNFLEINYTLNSFAYLGARAINNPETDKAAEIRQKYHYKELLRIMSEYPIFSDTFYVKSDGDSISYFEGFKKASEFWDLRNRTMSKNILHFVKENPGKKIIVLNGYFHRYYLNSLLKPKEEEMNFIIKEFYEY